VVAPPRLVRPWVPALIAVSVLLCTRSSIADHYVVPSGSMEPTVLTGDRIVVDKLAYGLRVPLTNLRVSEGSEPARGDVIVVASPETGIILLKRIAAVPGDMVEVIGGRVWIDGSPLLSDLGESISLERGGGPDLSRRRIPEGQYLLLGDNRGDSRDGRIFGLVDRGAILGRAVAVYARDGTPTWLGL